MQTFIPKINGGVPTRALGDALDRDVVRRATEMLQAAPPKPKPKPTEGK
jgi:hypothetical protein